MSIYVVIDQEEGNLDDETKFSTMALAAVVAGRNLEHDGKPVYICKAIMSVSLGEEDNVIVEELV